MMLEGVVYPHGFFYGRDPTHFKKLTAGTQSHESRKESPKPQS